MQQSTLWSINAASISAISATYTDTFLVTFDLHGHMLTCPFYMGHKIGSGIYMSGVGLGSLRLDYIMLMGTDPPHELLVNTRLLPLQLTLSTGGTGSALSLRS
jgi:hypothetical protein